MSNYEYKGWFILQKWNLSSNLFDVKSLLYVGLGWVLGTRFSIIVTEGVEVWYSSSSIVIKMLTHTDL